MDDDELLIHGLNHQQRLVAVGIKLKDIGDDLERKTRKNNHLPYGSWMCFITVILTISAYCFPSTDRDISYL
jgi:hypothetical protein